MHARLGVCLDVDAELEIKSSARCSTENMRKREVDSLVCTCVARVLLPTGWRVSEIVRALLSAVRAPLLGSNQKVADFFDFPFASGPARGHCCCQRPCTCCSHLNLQGAQSRPSSSVMTSAVGAERRRLREFQRAPWADQSSDEILRYRAIARHVAAWS